jgi:hypothetical protein
MATAGKSTVFLVTDLPIDQTYGPLAARLRSVIDANLQEEEGSRFAASETVATPVDAVQNRPRLRIPTWVQLIVLIAMSYCLCSPMYAGQ